MTLACLRLSFFLTGLASVTLVFYPLVGGSGHEGPDFMQRLAGAGLYAAILVVTIFLETSLGLCCSLVCRSTLQSMVATYSVVLILFGVPMAVQALLLAFARGLDTTAIAWICFVSPFQAVYSVSPKPSLRAPLDQPQVWAAYLAFAALVSALLISYVHRRFEHWAAASRAR